jgi:hypothetical protein
MKEEMERCKLQWSKTPAFKQLMELEKITWGTKIKNTYAIALDIRKNSIIKRLRKQREDYDLKEKGRYLKRNFSALISCLGYLFIFLLIFVVLFPPLLINYFRSQIENGEWIDVSEFANFNGT